MFPKREIFKADLTMVRSGWLPLTVCGLAKVAIFTTKLDLKN
jgi:hypothetical protein